MSKNVKTKNYTKNERRFQDEKKHFIIKRLQFSNQSESWRSRESADSNHLMADENSLIFCFSIDDLWYWVTAIFYHRILQCRWMKSQAYGRCWSIECSIWHSRIIFAFTIVNMPTVIVNHCNIFNLKGKNGIHFTINVFYEKMSSAVDEAR